MSSASTFVQRHDWSWSPIGPKAKVTLSANGKTVDGKSLLGITSLLAKKGTVVTIEADGEDESKKVRLRPSPRSFKMDSRHQANF